MVILHGALYGNRNDDKVIKLMKKKILIAIIFRKKKTNYNYIKSIPDIITLH